MLRTLHENSGTERFYLHQRIKISQINHPCITKGTSGKGDRYKSETQRNISTIKLN